MKFTVLGCGAMGSAIVEGALRNSYLNGNEVTLFDLNTEALKRFADEYQVRVSSDLGGALDGAEAVMLGVKPQHQDELLSQVTPLLTKATPLVISIAAGRTIDTIAAKLPECTPIVRVMPNVNALVGASISGMARNESVSDAQWNWAEGLFNAVGIATPIPENYFSVYSAIGGCSPAWMYRFVDALAQAAVAHGLPKAQATQIVAQSMYGSGLALLEQLAEGRIPQNLVDQVCSPGGTTVAGLLAMEDSGFSTAARAAVDAAVSRDQEISQQ